MKEFRPLVPHGSAFANPPRRRDRHGRGVRGPLIPPAMPGWRSRSEQFDELVLDALESLRPHVGPVIDRLEVGVEDVPPSSPAPWETGAVPLGRFFPADPAAGLEDRIAVYRRPIAARCEDVGELALLVREVLVEQIAHLTGRDPGDLDPR